MIPSLGEIEMTELIQIAMIALFAGCIFYVAYTKLKI
jgi:hypothetical protein